MTKKTTKKDEPSEIPTAPAVFDVSKPGETAAHPTSKPVIVGHTSILKQDPMVSPVSEIEEKDNSSKTPAKKSELVIEPPEVEQDEVKNEEKIETTEEDVPEKVEEADPVEEDTKSNQKIDEKPDSSDSGEINALATEAESKKNTKTALEEEQKQLEKTEELINSKKYFLPIVEGGKKRSSEIMLLWLLLFLVLITVVAWFVVDAGYYDPGFELPYDFIKN